MLLITVLFKETKTWVFVKHEFNIDQRPFEKNSIIVHDFFLNVYRKVYRKRMNDI